MSGLEIVPLAIQSFQLCIQAYQFFYTVGHMDQEVDLVRSRLQWEQYRLVEWGQRAGLNKTPDNRLNWSVACGLLEQQHALLTSADKLKRLYNLQVQEEEELVHPKNVSVASELDFPDSGIGKLVAKLRPDIYTTSAAQSVRIGGKAFRRLRWATIGRKQADRVIQDIAEQNTRLWQLLDSAEQLSLRNGVDALLRDIISRSNSTSEVETVQQLLNPGQAISDKALAAAASLKQIRLTIGVDKTDDEIPPQLTRLVKEKMPVLKRLKARKVKAKTLVGIETGKYDGEDVVIEWKVVDKPVWKDFRQQVEALAVLLTALQDSSFHALSCIGYLPWEEKERYAIVYELPPTMMEGPSTGLKSLYEVLGEEPKVSLYQRVQIALDLSETLLQLHTAGWLHKGIRSENVRFTIPEKAKTGSLLESPMYLVGYEYSRPDTTGAALMTELPDTNPYADLYRHPQARGNHRMRFHKRFDVYALGCVLLELALWKRIVDVQSEFTSHDLGAAILKAEIDKKDVDLPDFLKFGSDPDQVLHVRHSAGKVFTDAIIACFSPEGGSGDASESYLGTQKAVVDKLRSCRC
ncbi:uncharacterized protein BDZ99DRAFT_565660 [Mytilinidion resinicola]|uniref:Protein kinase domain-containing protein n=1 Tax=Mytilinidion resinicola TaxID=574789 RepID=A0A6A6Z3I9_9PEZI|nr:uncharacterized protein BDZ99DRAFT_565660 [Mytilinidion resinicola]KAF2815722.1 hypothetical protein BDZ99DRAFT_565660 [Mytilinidion resinicola]